MASVVVVEDDPAIRHGLQQALRDRSYVVATSPTGLGALELIMRVEPDVVLLDLGLPDVDGLQVLGMLRGVSQVPVIVITARDDDPTIVLALDAGADDYVVKPFGLDHVAARIRAVLRRGGPTDGDSTVRVGDLEIDPRQRTVALDGAPVDLTRKEFDLLLALASRSGEVVSKRTLLAEVWQQAHGGSDRTVDVHLSWLRRKLGETALEPRYLLTVRASAWWIPIGPADAEADPAPRRGDDISGRPGVRDPAVPARAQHGGRPRSRRRRPGGAQHRRARLEPA
ncbi:MAG: response regulator transcription factor [Nocardioidaceae bacterium]